jgi:hypothetical protein
MEEEERANNLRYGKAAVEDIKNPEILRDGRGEDDPEPKCHKQAQSGRGAAFVRVIPYIPYAAITGHSTVPGVQCPRN